jgi:hypothetical protein
MRGTCASFLILVLAGVLPAARGVSAQPAPAASAEIATVVERVLPAQIKGAGEVAWKDVEDGAAVRLGDSFRTGPGGRVKMIFDDKSILILAEKSVLDITRHVYDPSTKQRESLYKLYEGKVRALVGELFGANSKFEIQSPTAVAGVKGTDFEESYAKPCTTIYSNAGSVYGHNVDPKVVGEVIVQGGMYTVICERKPPTNPQDATEEFKKKTIPLRADETLHPPPGGGGVEEGGPQGGPPTDERKPKYPTDILQQPTDTGGIPTKPATPTPPPPPPQPEQNIDMGGGSG